MIDANSGKGTVSGGFYFAARNQINERTLLLLPDEARHAVRVLRLKTGDEIHVVDGEGGWYRAQIEKVDREGLHALICETRRDVGEPDYRLTIGIGLLKQQARFETFLEKAVELGVTRIIPLITDRGQSKTINRKRCQKILIAGMKQALRSRLPGLVEPRPFNAVIREDAPVRLIAHEKTTSEATILSHLDSLRDAGACHVLIGPEGGFSDGEVDRALKAGWTSISLGQSRLRTETAGIAVASLIQMIKSARRQA